MRPAILLALSGGFLCIAASVSNAASFSPVGDLPGGGVYSRANAISADGSTVVGVSYSASSLSEAFVWNETVGIQALGDLPGGGSSSYATGVSGDGSVIVGGGLSASGSEAFRWTASTGMVGLGDLPGGVFRSLAYAVSDDGTTIVGYSESTSGTEAFIHDASQGLVGLGDLTGGSFRSEALDVSADGSIVVGSGSSSSGGEAFRWDATNGMVGLGDLPGGNFGSAAYGVSADGTIIVGEGDTILAGFEAFRWDAANGMAEIDPPPGCEDVRALDASLDGSIVVGEARCSVTEETAAAFIWDATNGSRVLSVVLTDLGVDLTGWTLYSAKSISADGLAIVGDGRSPSGTAEGWIARLDPSPMVPVASVWTRALLLSLLIVLGTRIVVARLPSDEAEA